MTKEEIIELGTSLGIPFREETNFKDALEQGRVVFSGINNQRFLFESSWSNEDIMAKMGESLIQMGERKKAMEISNALKII